MRQSLPPGFQRSEFLQSHGFVDMIVPRKELKSTIALSLRWFGAARGWPELIPSMSDSERGRGRASPTVGSWLACKRCAARGFPRPRPSSPGAERLGSPEQRVPAVHIAGTNGKGSCAALTDSILRQAGLRTGLFTSPHLSRFTERIRIDGVEIDGDRLAFLDERWRPRRCR
jgi:hypothetical protein